MRMSLTSRNACGSLARGAGRGLAAALVLLAACTDPANRPVAGALTSAEQPAANGRAEARPVDLGPLAAAHKADPTDATAALAYARALRASGAKREALAVLDKAAGKGTDRQLQLERGLLALDLGEPAKAERLLRQAHDPKAPDWRVHSGLGAALASRGRQQLAQEQFAKALALAPDHPSVLNNLALSFALDGNPAEAEKLLRKAERRAGAMPQVHQNLALVVGLAGRYEESRKLGEAALPPARASENAAYLQRLASDKYAPGETEAVAPGKAAARRASLPQPSYQLGAPPPAGEGQPETRRAQRP
jgi:Flp pilus assembly protein TadD